MTTWQKPSFEELAMNAEIGAYQADDWDGERQGGLVIECEPPQAWSGRRASAESN